MFSKRNHAFTLIELLVVVAIIGILATVVIVNVSTAQTKAKDAKVRADLAQVSIAAEKYAISSTNYYIGLNCSGASCDALASSTDEDLQSIGRISQNIRSVNNEGLTIVATNKSYLASTHLFSAPSPQQTITVSNIAGSEISLNPGFESDFTSWATAASDGAFAVTTTAGEFHTGSKAAKITMGATTAFLTGAHIYSQPSVTGSTTYYYSFWTRGDGTNAGMYGIYGLGGATGYLVNPISTGVTGTSYQLVSGSFTTNTGNTSVQFIFGGAALNGAIAYFDDISIKQF